MRIREGRTALYPALCLAILWEGRHQVQKRHLINLCWSNYSLHNLLLAPLCFANIFVEISQHDQTYESIISLELGNIFMKRDLGNPLVNSFKLNFVGSQSFDFVPLKRAMMRKRDTVKEGSGAPIFALYKIALLLSGSQVCTHHVSFGEKKKSSSD